MGKVALLQLAAKAIPAGGFVKESWTTSVVLMEQVYPLVNPCVYQYRAHNVVDFVSITENATEI